MPIRCRLVRISIMKARFVQLSALLLWLLLTMPIQAQQPFGELEPLVQTKNITSRVITVQNPAATVAFESQPAIVSDMFRQGLLALTHTNSVAAAWMSLISNQDIVGIKVYTVPGKMTGTRLASTEAVVKSLIEAGIPRNHIVLWDRRLSDLRRAGFITLADRLGVEAAGAEDAGYDDQVFYESAIIGTLIYGDSELNVKDKPGAGRKSFVTKLITHRLTKLILLSPLVIHNEAGVAGNLFSLAIGSVDNTQRFEAETRRLATAIPEIYAMEAVGDKVVLSITDALICQYQGEVSAQLHYSVPLNQLRLSKDPVALDFLSLKEIKKQRERAQMPVLPENLEIYENAALLELGVCEDRKIEVQKFP